MDLPPMIPTSFVPHPGALEERKFRGDLVSAFGFFSYVLLGIVFVLALGVFFYGRLLSSNQSAKEAALTKAEAAIDPVTIEAFVRLKERLTSGATLLANHTAFSGFFSLLETLLPESVRFTALHLSVDAVGVAKIEGFGVAKNFNALASASSAFSADGRIKDAIFSNIVVNPRGGSVSFALSATLDPKLITFMP